MQKKQFIIKKVCYMKSYTFSLINKRLIFVLFYLFVNKFTSKNIKIFFILLCLIDKVHIIV
ncbi:hypothetical protein E6L37_13140 [Enterococcus lactis]|uniref:Uncharacterized protein n=1 Tax=Enterococcus faecium TaxID=1352 RepID=A0AAI8LLE3_ENTFC|nr:hypothetical protein D9Z05_09445 [Enterococcus faecium]QPB63670.1 hypothetical protein GFB66_09235 [Enterococcus faecium]TKA98851.1 hypothetical protein E6L37_13140 [Enterococcus lactis]